METKSLLGTSKRFFWILVMLSIFIIGAWTVNLWFKLPHDDYRENITLLEAQDLVSFGICLPTYIPQDIDPKPTIIYYADVANIPQETFIQLRYENADNHKTVFEVYERYTQDEGMKTAYPESAHGGTKASLLDWIAYPRFLSDSEIKTALERTQMESMSFQSDQIVWWLYQIVDPIEYRSTMTKWITNNVEYRIMSYLSVNEIKKITESMIDCSNP